jgi:hypothetical protein
VVPDLERGEFLNVGIILFSKQGRSLLTRVRIDEDRLRSLAAVPDIDVVRAHLGAFERIAAGGPQAGPLGHLSPSQRFHWLVAPRSTMIQTSAVHSGLCADHDAEAERLFWRLVAPRDEHGSSG